MWDGAWQLQSDLHSLQIRTFSKMQWSCGAITNDMCIWWWRPCGLAMVA